MLWFQTENIRHVSFGNETISIDTNNERNGSHRNEDARTQGLEEEGGNLKKGNLKGHGQNDGPSHEDVRALELFKVQQN